jgi:6-pyruvoyltetrahydropterin/6-carboxytetrahydropterin synthase
MTTTVTVRHNFETAHRLPHLGGKCQSLHGHSWWAEVTVGYGELYMPHDQGPSGVVMDFGDLKLALRGWIDHYLDHGTMLGVEDPLEGLLQEHACKVFVFDPERELTSGLHWPTVENVAKLLRRVTKNFLAAHPAGLRVMRVQVTETATNAAEVTP